MGAINPKGKDICIRTRRFAIEIITFYSKIQSDDVGRIIGKQLLRSGTSIGANMEEGQAAESKRDFLHKMKISLKEARETLYWLHLLEETRPDITQIILPLMAEADQIIRIIYTIVKKTERNSKQPIKQK